MLEWVEFGKTRSVDLVRKAVKMARKKENKKPPDDRFGLPNVEVVLRYVLTCEEHDLVEKATRKVMHEIRESLGGSKGMERRWFSCLCRSMVLILTVIATAASESMAAEMPDGRNQEKTPFDAPILGGRLRIFITTYLTCRGHFSRIPICKPQWVG